MPTYPSMVTCSPFFGMVDFVKYQELIQISLKKDVICLKFFYAVSSAGQGLKCARFRLKNSSLMKQLWYMRQRAMFPATMAAYVYRCSSFIA
jgi:hypothetical protein